MARVLIMSRLAGAHLSELNFGKFGHLKDVSLRCLVQSYPQKSVNLQSIKNRINKMIFSRYAQDPRNVTSWRHCLGGTNFQVSPDFCPWTSSGGLQCSPKFPAVNSLACLGRSLFGQKFFSPLTNFSSRFTNEIDLCSLEFFLGVSLHFSFHIFFPDSFLPHSFIATS